jgi:hypothetical protein
MHRQLRHWPAKGVEVVPAVEDEGRETGRADDYDDQTGQCQAIPNPVRYTRRRRWRVAADVERAAAVAAYPLHNRPPFDAHRTTWGPGCYPGISGGDVGDGGEMGRSTSCVGTVVPDGDGFGLADTAMRRPASDTNPIPEPTASSAISRPVIGIPRRD